jgi:hypothetical protein
LGPSRIAAVSNDQKIPDERLKELPDFDALLNLLITFPGGAEL